MNRFAELSQRNAMLAPLIALVLLVIGLVLGLVIGWSTVDFKPGADDVVMAADSFALNPNADLAKARLKGLSKAEQETLVNQLVADRNKKGLTREAERLTALGQALGVNVTGTTPAIPGGTTQPTRAPGATSSSSAAPGTAPAGASSPLDMLIPILGIMLIIILVAAAGLIFYTRILPGLRKPATATATPTGATVTTTTAPAAAANLRHGVAPAPTTSASGLGRFVPTYVLGNDNYDTSYSLETSKGEFLGECGMGISETIGEGKPDKVTAFDLWLFDKADVRTVTQILMSDFAFKDQTLRTKLATKGEAILAEKGKTVRLETQSLAIDAHIVELVYASNPSFPPNSHFQKLVIEIVPTMKETAAVVR